MTLNQDMFLYNFPLTEVKIRNYTKDTTNKFLGWWYSPNISGCCTTANIDLGKLGLTSESGEKTEECSNCPANSSELCQSVYACVCFTCLSMYLFTCVRVFCIYTCVYVWVGRGCSRNIINILIWQPCICNLSTFSLWAGVFFIYWEINLVLLQLTNLQHQPQNKHLHCKPCDW